MHHLFSHPKLKKCSAETILRAIKELTVDNTTYTSPASGKSYDFNTADQMNELLIKSLLATGGLCGSQEYDLDFDHQFIQAEKYDAKRTYKKFLDYSPGVAVIGDNIVSIKCQGASEAAPGHNVSNIDVPEGGKEHNLYQICL